MSINFRAIEKGPAMVFHQVRREGAEVDWGRIVLAIVIVAASLGAAYFPYLLDALR